MRKKLTIFTLFILFSLVCRGDRVKRKIVFRKNTKMFLRVNGIEPFFEKQNTIFRLGYGFRANWPLPDDIEKIHQLFKRDAHEDVNRFVENPEYEEIVCILKYFSQLVTKINFEENCNGGVLCNISKIIKRSDGQDVKYLKRFFNKISNVEGLCPQVHYVPLINNEVY